MKAMLMGLAVLFLSANIYASNLIVNGDFESPVVTHPNNWTTYYGQNFTGTCTVECYGLVDGWSVWWADDLTAGRLELQRGPVSGILPFKNNQKAELDSHHRAGNDNNNVVIFQFMEVCEGEPYVLDYAWKSRTPEEHDNDIFVLVDELIVRNHSLNSKWMTETLNFVATDNIIHAAFVSFGTSNTRGMYMDDIQLNGNSPEECDYTPEDICLDGKPSGLNLLYSGINGINHGQDPSEVHVVPEFVANFPNPAYIRMYDDNNFGGKGRKQPTLISSETVNIGEVFSLGVLKNGKVPPKATFVIIDPATNKTVQTIHFHTSCSQPLNELDKFGVLTIWSSQ